MQCQVETITPDRARELLKRNTSNRHLANSRVAKFENQLRRGEMQLTHQGIAISQSGNLLDGQHRLHAIANTGIPAQMLVATGLPDEVFTVLDTGSARTASDVLGIDGAPNATTMAAGIRLVMAYWEFPQFVWSGARVKTIGSTTAVLEQYHSNPQDWQWAAKTAQANANGKILVPSAMSALLYLALDAGFSTDYLSTFTAKIREGIGLMPGDPILAYRNKLIQYPQGATRISGQERLADYIKLLNSYATGQRLKIFKSQAFPPMPTIVDPAECEQ